MSQTHRWAVEGAEEAHAILNAILEPLIRLRQAGARLPTRLFFSFDGFLVEEHQAALARFEPETDTLLVHPDGGLWHPGLLQMAFDRVPRDTSSPHLQAVTYHEAAHWLVYYHSPLLYNLLHDPTSDIYQDDLSNWFSQVSVYAGENALEFVAEVYAAFQTGVPLEPGVNEVYQRMLGNFTLPEVRR